LGFGALREGKARDGIGRRHGWGGSRDVPQGHRVRFAGLSNKNRVKREVGLWERRRKDL